MSELDKLYKQLDWQELQYRKHRKTEDKPYTKHIWRTVTKIVNEQEKPND